MLCSLISSLGSAWTSFHVIKYLPSRWILVTYKNPMVQTHQGLPMHCSVLGHTHCFHVFHITNIMMCYERALIHRSLRVSTVVTVLVFFGHAVTYLIAVMGVRIWACVVHASFSREPDHHQRAGSCSGMPGGEACDGAVKSVHFWASVLGTVLRLHI